MNDDPAQIAPATTRLGQLQRGRGAGFEAALRAGADAHDDLIRCIVDDPRVDRQLEERGRYYGELVLALDAPLAPIAQHLTGDQDERLGHEVLAAAWRLGHPEACSLLLSPKTDEALVAGIAGCLWATRWATRVELPPRAAEVWLRLELQNADSAQAAVRHRPATALANLTLPELLDLARDSRFGRRDRLLGELCARGDEATRTHLLEVASHDVVYERVRLASRALGLLGDERLLDLAEDHFARDDVFADPQRRLPGLERMRRSCLADYVQHLPARRALELARAYHSRGGYFETVAGVVFQEHATAADRSMLEAFVAERGGGGSGWDVICELDALGRLADPRSAPLLFEVAQEAAYSHARRRALHALAAMPQLDLAQQALREALWDCEDEAAADACAFVTTFDDASRERLVSLGNSPLADEELVARARQRMQRRG
ncbi:MAG: hypothetical protein KDC48_00980 [Planctomycetes bacterium]|nr:hypothetical protein [Planctomycetota bacterium]